MVLVDVSTHFFLPPLLREEPNGDLLVAGAVVLHSDCDLPLACGDALASDCLVSAESRADPCEFVLDELEVLPAGVGLVEGEGKLADAFKGSVGLQLILHQRFDQFLLGLASDELGQVLDDFADGQALGRGGSHHFADCAL